MSAVISCSNTAPETSSTTRTQTELPLGGAAISKVSTPPDAMAKDAPMSVSFGTPVPLFVTSCQRVWVPTFNSSCDDIPRNGRANGAHCGAGDWLIPAPVSRAVR